MWRIEEKENTEDIKDNLEYESKQELVSYVVEKSEQHLEQVSDSEDLEEYEKEALQYAFIELVIESLELGKNIESNKDMVDNIVSSIEEHLDGIIQYDILPGDVLSKIADDHGVDMQDILESNSQLQSPDQIQAGESIEINPEQSDLFKISDTGEIMLKYEGHDGEDIYISILELVYRGVSWEEIAEHNGVDVDAYPGIKENYEQLQNTDRVLDMDMTDGKVEFQYDGEKHRENLSDILEEAQGYDSIDDFLSANEQYQPIAGVLDMMQNYEAQREYVESDEFRETYEKAERINEKVDTISIFLEALEENIEEGSRFLNQDDENFQRINEIFESMSDSLIKSQTLTNDRTSRMNPYLRDINWEEDVFDKIESGLDEIRDVVIEEIFDENLDIENEQHTGVVDTDDPEVRERLDRIFDDRKIVKDFFDNEYIGHDKYIKTFETIRELGLDGENFSEQISEYILENPDALNEYDDYIPLNLEQIPSEDEINNFIDYVGEKGIDRLIAEFNESLETFSDSGELVPERPISSAQGPSPQVDRYDKMIEEKGVDSRTGKFADSIPEGENTMMFKLMQMGLFNDENGEYSSTKAREFFEQIQESFDDRERLIEAQRNELEEELEELRNKEDLSSEEDERKRFLEENMDMIVDNMSDYLGKEFIQKGIQSAIVEEIIENNSNRSGGYNGDNPLLEMYGDIEGIGRFNLSDTQKEAIAIVARELAITVAASAVGLGAVALAARGSYLLARGGARVLNVRGGLRARAMINNSSSMGGHALRGARGAGEAIPFHFGYLLGEEVTDSALSGESFENPYGEGVSEGLLTFMTQFGYLGATRRMRFRDDMSRSREVAMDATSLMGISMGIDGFSQGELDMSAENLTQEVVSNLIVALFYGGRARSPDEVSDLMRRFNDFSDKVGLGAFMGRGTTRAINSDYGGSLSTLSARGTIPTSILTTGITLESVMNNFEGNQGEEGQLDSRFENLVEKAENEEISTGEFRDEGKRIIDQIFEERLLNMIGPESVDNYEEIIIKLNQEKSRMKRLFEQALIEKKDQKHIYDIDGLGSEYFRNVVLEQLRERLPEEETSEDFIEKYLPG
ncbi:LysM peptidoglycan-binding domain-containing protein [Candidatus Absconditicoccus praedator]|nr:LysM peptidoglycan-binding domain-containing protein [Candidatus Absconditicoccus praedator]